MALEFKAKTKVYTEGNDYEYDNTVSDNCGPFYLQYQNMQTKMAIVHIMD